MKKIDVPSVFGKTTQLQNQIDQLLDTVSQAGMVFEEGIEAYQQAHGVDEGVEEKLQHLSELEKKGNELRRSIETTLFTEMLIPDSRGDVLHLLDALDHLIDVLHGRFQAVTIEDPQGPEELGPGFKELVSHAIKSVETLIQASRAYFRDVNATRDHLHKIAFYEQESDKTAVRLKKQIFAAADLQLDQKMLLRDYVDSIDGLADKAENVAEQMAMSIIKRSL